jgi:hypothetical protein
MLLPRLQKCLFHKIHKFRLIESIQVPKKPLPSFVFFFFDPSYCSFLISRALHHDLSNGTSGRAAWSHSLCFRYRELRRTVVILRSSAPCRSALAKFPYNGRKNIYVLRAPSCLGSIHYLKDLSVKLWGGNNRGKES